MAETHTVGDGQAFATIQEAIDAASAGDTIEIAAGSYAESLTITTEGLTLVGIGAVEVNGTFSEDNAGYNPESESLAEWLKDAAAYVQGSVGIAIGAENVSISNITVKDSTWGIELLDGANFTTLTDVVLASNMYGIYKQATSGLAGLSIDGGSISDGYIGISFDKTAADGGDATGVTIDGTGFSNLLRKGIYVETLSDAHLTGITMDDVGQWGSIGPNNSGISGAGGNGISINLKFGDYTDIEIDGFTFTDVGASNREGADDVSHANGGAIVIAVRDDGGTYGPNPATLTNVTIHDGTISGTTSTAIHVGEPGKDNADPAVTVTNVTISATTEKSADHGDIANESEATMTVVGTDGNDSLVASGDSDGAFDIDGRAGNDVIAGGSGDDTLAGGTGSDTIEGGGGTDTAVYAATLARANITAVADADPVTAGDQAGWQVGAGAEGTDTLTGVEVIDHGGDANILLVGNGGFATIQAAIDAAIAGDTIMVAAGTYTESVVVNKDVTILGANADVAGYGDRGAESIVVGRFAFQADGGTVNGFTVEAPPASSGWYGVYIYGAHNNVTITNNILDGTNSAGDSKGIQTVSSLTAFTGVSITDNLIQNWTRGTYLNPGISDSELARNHYEDNGNHLNIDKPSGLSIVDNDFGTSQATRIAVAVFDNVNPADVGAELGLSGNTFGPGATQVTIYPRPTSGEDGQHIIGTPLNDYIRGDNASPAGLDAIYDGAGGDDRLVGDAGDDTLTGGAGSDTINGGGGNNTAVYAGTLTKAGITAIADTDPTTIGDQAGWQVAGGAEGTDTLSNIKFVEHAGGRLLLVGNGGFATIDEAAIEATESGDTIVLSAPPSTEDPIVIAITPTAPITLTIPYDNPTEITIESDFDNSIQTGGGDDVIIIDGDGDNIIKAGDGNDYVKAGGGSDQIIGGAGNGDDVYDGGGGGNTMIYTSATSAIIVDLNLLDRSTTPASEGGTVGDLLDAALGDGSANTPVGLASGLDIGTDALLNIADIVSGSGGDTLIGNGDANDIDGRAGDDTITGNAGADVLTGGLGVDDVDGGAGNDIVNYVVGEGTDTLLDGGADTDTLAITGRTGGSATAADTIKVGITGSTIVKLASNGDAHGIANNVANFETVTLDLLTGHSGDDTLDYSITTSSNAVSVDLGEGTATGFGGTILGVENVTGGAGNDTLTGDGNANVLAGDAGDDTLTGGGGVDVLTGGTGIDSVYGGAGNDTIHYTIGDGVDAAIDGGDNTDTVVVKGTAGNDTVDVLFNGTALTSLEGSGLTAIESVTVDALGGTDTLSYAGTTVAVAVNLGASTASGFTAVTGVEQVMGGDAGDSLTGDGGANRLEGDDGDDILDGGVGDDTLVGGTGADSLTGGTGTDTAVYSVVLGAGDATFDGTAWQVNGGTDGIDSLTGVERLSHGAPGQFLLVGGGGYADRATAEALMGADDVLVFAATTSAVTDTDGSANDVDEGAADGTLAGIDASATTGTGGGTVSYSLSDDAGGRFAIDAATGVVIVADGALLDFESAASHTITVRAANSLGAFSEQDFTIAVNDIPVEVMVGTNGKDTLNGGPTAADISGLGGKDKLHGKGGNDVLDGGKGNDKLYGGDGDDLLIGGKGKDRIEGGDGVDTVSYEASSKAVKINLNDTKQKGGDAKGDKLYSIENVTGSNKKDKLVGDKADNVLDGGKGKDTLDGKGGDDLLTGGKGNDTFYFKKGYDSDTIADFSNGDTIDITMKGLENFKALKGMVDEIDGDVVIYFGKGDILTILDTTIASLDKSDFHI